MGLTDLIGEFDEEDVNGEWEEAKREENKIPDSKWENDSGEDRYVNLNIAIKALEWKGKSCIATMFGYLNSEYFDKLNVKEEFPKTYDMLHTGLLPEVEKIKVLDLDGSYQTQSKAGVFGKLARLLYKDNKIIRNTIKIPKPKINYIDDQAVQVAKAIIAGTKLRIDQEISTVVADSGPEVLFIIDSMSSYDELLNDLFNIVYEQYIAKPRKGEADFNKEFAYAKGINQKYYRIRNGWWIDTLRDKRTFQGFQIDTIKMEVKPDLWLKKEQDKAKTDGKNPDEISPYKVAWVPRTKFDLDIVLTLDAKKAVSERGIEYINEMWTDSLIRMAGSDRSASKLQSTGKINLTPAYPGIAYEILEGLAPYLMGEVEKPDGTTLTEEEMWSRNR